MTEIKQKKKVSWFKEVESFMKRNVDATSKVLREKFPDYNEKTLGEYRSRILKSMKSNEKNLTKTQLSLPKSLDFPLFCKTLSYPPYYGLFRWQNECYNVVWGNKMSLVVVPRDHGKSVLWGNLSQYALYYENYDVLYLGWTDRRKEVAENIYNFFLLWDQIEKGGAKVSSAYHFILKNGGRFDTYLVTSKETLGKHAVGEQDRFDKLTDEDKKQLGKVFTTALRVKYMQNKSKERKLLIFIDDPIDHTFRKERHKEEKVETQYNSTIANINADKIINSGTRKFEEDFFYFLDMKYGKKLATYKRKTHLCTPNWTELDLFEDIDINTLDRFNPRYDELMEIILSKAIDHPCYNPKLDVADMGYVVHGSPTDNLLCPERWTEAKLKEKREEIGEYWWYAEYEGDPHPITGAVWDKVLFCTHWDDWTHYDYGFVCVDRATTTNKGSSWTGITVFIRDGRDGSKIVLKDLTGQYDFEDCLRIVDAQYKWLKDIFAHTIVKVVVEKQGGGDDFISSAENRKFSFAYSIEPFHQTRDKIERIKDYLRLPIKHGDKPYGVKFLDTLRTTELMKEIMEFPYPLRLDGIDSLATGVKVSEMFPVGNRKEILLKLKLELERKRVELMKRNSPVYNNPVQNPNFYKDKRRNIVF